MRDKANANINSDNNSLRTLVSLTEVYLLLLALSVTYA